MVVLKIIMQKYVNGSSKQIAKRVGWYYVITFLLVVASLQDCTGTRKEEMMNDFAPKASRNGKLVLQNILANDLSLGRNPKFL